MASGSYYNRYPIRCRTCFRRVDNKARNVELTLAGHKKPTIEVLRRAMDDEGLTLYCCRRYILAPEPVYYNMENRPAIEGVRQVSEAVAMEASQRLEGDFIFGSCDRSTTRSAPTMSATASESGTGVLPLVVPISAATTSRIIPQPLLMGRAPSMIPFPTIPLPSAISLPTAVPLPGLAGADPRSVPSAVQLQGLQMGINQAFDQELFTPILEEAEPAAVQGFQVPTEVGIPTYNPPAQSKPVMVAVGARHHTEVISGVTFLAS